MGSPTSPTSASSLSRSSSQPSSPGRPRSAKRGAWRVGVAKRLLPLPPPPPRASVRALPSGEQLPAAPLQILLRSSRRAAIDLGARRHAAIVRSVLAVGAVAQRALAVPAAPGAVVGAALEALQVAQRVVAHDTHVAAAPAVAAVGPAARDVRFAAEAHAAVAAGAGLDVDPRAIVEHATAS